jgi:uncharacterized protein involved in outer membrane biogenesis
VKRLAVILLLLVLVVVGAALVVPSFIDWNRYRPQIAAQIESATGRSVSIDGALSFQVLPSPTLSVDAVRVANIDGGSTRDMARIGALRVAVDISALLQGAVRVRSVRVVDPVILLERLQDGRVNWAFAGADGAGSRRAGGAVAVPMPDAPAGGQQPAAAPPSDSDGPGDGAGDGAGEGGLTVRLDSVRIDNGLVVYRDHGSGAETRVKNIALDLSAESLRGPFRAAGEVTVQDVTLALDAAVGEMAGGGAAMPVSANILLPATGDTLTLAGRLRTGADGPAFEGDLEARAANPGATLASFGPGVGGVAVPNGPAALKTTLSAGPNQATLRDLRISLGSDEARGEVVARYGPTLPEPEVEAAVMVRTLDLDALLASLQTVPTRPPETGGDEGGSDGAGQGGSETGGQSGGGQAGGHAPVPPSKPTPPAPPGGFQLPTGFTAALDLSAEAITWRGAVIRQVTLVAALADGRLTIAEAGAALPGASQVNASATVEPGEDGAPRVQGSVKARAGNLREVLTWLQVPVDQVPADRLRTLDFSANLGGTPTSVRVDGLDVTIDTTRATGAAVVALGKRLGLGVNLSVESLNLDAYMPGLSSGGGASAQPGTPAPSAGQAQPQPQGQGTAAAPSTAAPAGAAGGGKPLLAGLDALNGFDANFRLAVGTLTADALPISGIRADGSLLGGTLTLSSASIADLAGARLAASGGLSGFGGQAQFNDLGLSFETDNLERTARVLRLDLPPAASGLGAVSQSVRLSGTPAALDLTSRTALDGGSLDAKGKVTELMSGRPSFDLALNASHPDFVRLVRRVAPDYDPAGAPLGALALKTQARGSLDTVTLDGLDVGIGQTRMTGQARISLGGARPHIAAGLSTNALPVHAFLPAARQAWLGPMRAAPATVIPTAAMGRGAGAGAVTEAQAGSWVLPAAWSREPIDLSALSLVDADVNLRSSALIYQEHVLKDADIGARLADGVLRVERLTGILHGGQADGDLTVVAGNPATYDLRLSVQDFSVASLLGLDGAIGAVGTGSMQFDGGSTGSTVADVIAALTGAGDFALTDLDVRAGQLRGSSLAGVLEPVAALNDFAGNLMGNVSQAERLADLSSQFRIENGRLSFDPLSLISALYQGEFAGMINLLDWTIDADGAARIADGPLKQALGSIIKLPDEIPLSIAGALDNPNVTMLTGGLPTSREALESQAETLLREEGQRVIEDLAPEAEEVLREIAPGAENILQGILGGGQPAPQPQPQAQPQAQPQPGNPAPDAQPQDQPQLYVEEPAQQQPAQPQQPPNDPNAIVNDLLRGLTQ